MSDVRSDMSTERRASDRRRTETEAMHTNPEVMGRSEPVDMDRSIRPQPQPDRSMPRSDRQLSFWPEMGDYRRRLADIQSEFIEEPRAAVKKAERLIEEAVDHMAKSMREHVTRMHGDVEGNADTEKLRLVMRSYREFIDSLDSRRAT